MDSLHWPVKPEVQSALKSFGRSELQAARLTDVLSRVAPGTNSWLDEDEQISAWLSGRADLNWVAPGQERTMKAITRLWFYGEVGCGRTTIAACVARKLLARRSPQEGVCYCFCDIHVGGDSLNLIVKTSIAQLAEQSDRAFEVYKRSVSQKMMPAGFEDQHADGATFDEDNEQHLGMLLASMSIQFERVSLVVSRMDYMLPQVIMALSSLVDLSDGTIRTAFTTHNGPDMQGMCIDTVSCPVSIVVAPEDIRLYFRSQVQRRIAQGAAYLQSREDALQTIEDFVVNRPSNSWLWTVLFLVDQFDLLWRGLWHPPAAAVCDDRNGRGLYGTRSVVDTYLERVLHDPESLPKFILTNASRWLCTAHSYPPLQLPTADLLSCLEILFCKAHPSVSSVNISDQDVLKACGPLVRQITSGPLEGFHLSHATISSYLIEELAGRGQPLGSLQIDGYSTARAVEEMDKACKILEKTKPARAEQLYLGILEVKEHVWGPDASDTLVTVEHIGGLYMDQGRLEEAETMFRRVLAGYERQPPIKLENKYNATNLLAITCKRQGKYEEAEALYKATLEGRRQLFGNEHQSTVSVLNSMGMMHAAQHREEEALNMWTKCLAPYEQLFGAKHKDTIMLVYNLGLVQKNLGQVQEAEKLLSRAHREYTEAFGPEDNGSLDAAGALAHAYVLLGKEQDAETLYLRLLSIYERTTGQLSENTLETCHSLAKVYQGQNREGESEKMCRRALTGYEQTVGPDDIRTTDVTYTLFLQLHGEEGVELGKTVLRSFETIHGTNARVTHSVADNLGLLYAELGRLEDAEPMWKRAYRGHSEKRGPRDEVTLAAAKNLGLLCKMQGREAESKEWLTTALGGHERLGEREDATEKI